jgi:protease I
MVQNSLTGRRIAILSTLGFEKVEFVAVRDALVAAGATVHVVSPEGPTIRAFEFPEWAVEVEVDRTLAEARADDYDGLYLPGGIIKPDLLRLDARAIALVRAFGDQGKPIGAMCHGPWLLISAGLARGRRIAAWPSLKWDLENAGAAYVDEPVVRDGPFVTACNPDDIPQLNPALVEHFRAPAHAGAAE